MGDWPPMEPTAGRQAGSFGAPRFDHDATMQARVCAAHLRLALMDLDSAGVNDARQSDLDALAQRVIDRETELRRAMGAWRRQTGWGI